MSEAQPSDEIQQERMVLAGSRFHLVNNTWSEWGGKTFEDVCEAIAARAQDKKANSYPSEVVEVVVVRRAIVKAEITVEEAGISGSQEVPRGS